MNTIFTIKNLQVTIQNKTILNDIDLNAQNGDVIAVLGPNGAGKSTLLKAIMHHFNVLIKKGSISYNGKKINDLSTDQIAKLGIFYASQNPVELDGVQMLEFLKLINNNTNTGNIPFFKMYTGIQKSLKNLDLPDEILTRNVNVGFSGGQKKKSEILQAELFNPNIILLDEIDSGLDVDAMKIISNFITNNRTQRITIIVSHHIEFLQILKPNKVIVLVDGNLAATGDSSLVETINKTGYKSFKVTNKPKEEFEKSDPYLVCRKK